MGYLSLSLIMYGATIFLYIIYYRLLVFLKKNRLRAFMTLPLMMVTTACIFWRLPLSHFYILSASWDISIPVSAYIFYVILTAITTIQFISPAIGEPSPTDTLIRILKKKGLAGKQYILASFKHTDLVQDRVHGLLAARIIVRQGQRIELSLLGKWVYKLLNWYGRLLQYTFEV
jgi:hypothetical protein